MILSSASRRLVVDAGDLYWGVLDGSSLGPALSARRERQLGYLFEHVLPLPIEEVWAVYRRLPGSRSRYLACGMRRARLLALQHDPGGAPITLSPDDVPTALGEEDGLSAITAPSINLLTGPFESPHVKSLRRWWLVLLAIVLLATCAALVVGLERRTRAMAERTESLRRARMSMLEQALGTDTVAGAQPPELRLKADLRMLRRTHVSDPGVVRAPDVSGALAGLVELWPLNLDARTESISIAPEAISVRVILPGTDDVHRLETALDRLEGWAVQTPQVSNTSDAVRAMLRLERTYPRPEDRSP